MLAIEAIRHADAIGHGLGPKAFELYQRTCSVEVRPRLLRQQEALSAYTTLVDARVALGRPAFEVVADADVRAAANSADAIAKALDAEVSEVWRRLREEISALVQRANGGTVEVRP